MKKSLLNNDAVEEMVARAQQLNPGTAGRWGKMNAAEMLLHCTLANNFILEDESPYQKPTIKQRVIKMMLFKVIAKIPRNRRGPLRLEAKGKIDSSHFEVQRQKYIETLRRFPVHPKPFTSLHAKLGSFTREQWGIFTWMHMDHHLRQFGV